MRIRLIQLDGKLPNIALMKLASHHRGRGDHVELLRAKGPSSLECGLWETPPDTVYASTIFERTRPMAERLLQIYPDAIIGGTGWNLTTVLPEHIDSLQPDYSDYPKYKHSIGFTQRGCRLKCKFCVVPGKEGSVKTYQTIWSIYRGPGHPRHLVLLDNDFFGQEHWRKNIDDIREGSFKVNFNQGINARMITEDVAEAVASVDYRDAKMDRKCVYTAWDNKGDESRLFRGLQMLVDAGVKPSHIMVYMLVGYWSGETHHDREYRRRKIRDFGSDPYPMPFVRTRELIGFQRWCVGAYDKHIPWSAWEGARYRPERLGRREQMTLPIEGEVVQ